MVDVKGMTDRHIITNHPRYEWRNTGTASGASVSADSVLYVDEAGIPTHGNFWGEVQVTLPTPADPIEVGTWRVAPSRISLPLAITGPLLDDLPIPDRVIQADIPEPQSWLLAVIGLASLTRFRATPATATSFSTRCPHPGQ